MDKCTKKMVLIMLTMAGKHIVIQAFRIPTLAINRENFIGVSSLDYIVYMHVLKQM